MLSELLWNQLNRIDMWLASIFRVNEIVVYGHYNRDNQFLG